MRSDSIDGDNKKMRASIDRQSIDECKSGEGNKLKPFDIDTKRLNTSQYESRVGAKKQSLDETVRFDENEASS